MTPLELVTHVSEGLPVSPADLDAFIAAHRKEGQHSDYKSGLLAEEPHGSAELRRHIAGILMLHHNSAANDLPADAFGSGPVNHRFAKSGLHIWSVGRNGSVKGEVAGSDEMVLKVPAENQESYPAGSTDLPRISK
jgi:hypothetical protein